MNRKRVEKLTKAFIEEMGLDPESERLRKTPARVASLFEEIFKDTEKNLKQEITVYRTKIKNDMVILRGIPFFSFCEHHLLPFFGRIHIAYIPEDGVITGFSSFVCIVKTISRKLQLQERLTDEIAETIADILKPEGVLVIVEARHLCIEMLGEKPPGTEVVTTSARGKMDDLSFKETVISMIKG